MSNKHETYSLIRLAATMRITASKQPPEFITAKLGVLDVISKSVSLYESYGIERWLLDSFVRKKVEQILACSSFSELEGIRGSHNLAHTRESLMSLIPEEELILRTIIFLQSPFPEADARRYEQLLKMVSRVDRKEDAVG